MLPIIRPLPGAPAAGAGDWIPIAVVVGLLAVAAALTVAVSLVRGATAGRATRTGHRDLAA